MEVKTIAVRLPLVAVAMTPGPSQGLSWRLQHVKRRMRSINEDVRPLAAGVGVDDCLLQHLESQTCQLESDLANITKDILSLEDDPALLDDGLRIEEALSNMSLSIKGLLRDRLGNPRPRAIPGTTKNQCAIF